LAKIFWHAHTELPWLPDSFDDPQLGAFAKALYFTLVPAGDGTIEIDVSSMQSRIQRLWQSSFAQLDLSVEPRQRRRLFKRLLAAAVRCASQTNLWTAKLVILGFLQRGDAAYGPADFTGEEQSLLELRYGACRALGDINVGLLFGCGPLFAELVNSYAITRLHEVPLEVREAAERLLRDYIFLLAEMRRRRKLARAAQRRELRGLRADRMPGRRPRMPLEGVKNPLAGSPSDEAAANEDWRVVEAVMPTLKPRDARRLRALIDFRGDKKAAATSLGLDLETFSRQLRQTVLPHLQEAASRYRHKLEGRETGDA
jgi:hypothetical protein